MVKEGRSQTLSFTLVVRGVCMEVQIRGVTRTCLLDTRSEVSLFPAGLVPLGPKYGR